MNEISILSVQRYDGSVDMNANINYISKDKFKKDDGVKWTVVKSY